MRIHTILAITIMLGLGAQSIGALIPHPRLYFTGDDLPRLREFGFKSEEMLVETEMTIKYFGGKEVTFPLPPEQPGTIEEPPGFDHERFGHYPYWTMMSRNIQRRMQPLALAYASTGEKQYARRAIDYALALSKWSVWTDLDYGTKTCLDTCHITFGMATVYDACHDAMTDDERRIVSDAIITLGLEPLFRDMQPEVEHNMQMLRAAALGTGALAVFEETDKAQAYLDSAKAYFQWYLDSRAVSQNIESMGYLSYGLDTGVIFADVLHRATGDDSLVAHPYLDQVIRMAIYFQCPRASGLVNFSDCGIANYFGTIAKVLNRSLDHGPAGWYLTKSRLKFDAGWGGAIYGGPIGMTESPDRWPTSAVFRPIDWVSLRSGWSEDDTMLAMVCGNSKMGHNHRDQNSIILNHAGEWLIVDAGYKSFEGGPKSFYGQNTVGHNSLLVDGEGQDKLGGGKVTSFFASGVFDYTVGDASGSYDPKKLSKFLRRVVQVKPGYYVIFDEAASDGTPRQFEILLHTDTAGRYLNASEPMNTGDRASFSTLTIAKEKASVDAHLLLPRGRIVELTEYEGAESYGPYASISPAEKTSDVRFLTTLVPIKVGETNRRTFIPVERDRVVTVEVEGDGVDIVGFRTGRGSIEAGDVSFLGECFVVRTNPSGETTGYGIFRGQKLHSSVRSRSPVFMQGMKIVDPGETLFLSSAAASIGVSCERKQAEISLSRDANVRLNVAMKPSEVRVDEKPARFQYDWDSGMIALSLTEGNHTLTWR